MRNDQRTGLKVACIRATSGATSNTTVFAADNYRFSVLHVLLNASGAGKSVTVQMQDSADNVSFDNVGSSVVISGGTAESLGSILIDHQKTRRYVRASVTPSGSANTSINLVQFNELVTPDAVANVTNSVL